MAAALEALLREGVAAARAGEAGRARACLQPVLESDGANVAAWYWLSRSVESPREQAACLERVLALDPGHTAVQAELAALRRQLARSHTSSSSLADALSTSYAGAVPHTAEEQLVSAASMAPLPCPFCGAQTAAEHHQCPTCAADLYVRERRRTDHSPYSLGLVAIWFALANYIWLALAGYYILASLSSALQESTRMARTLATVKGLLGIEASRALAPELPLIPLLLTGGAAFLLSLVVAWGVYRRSPLFYWLTVGAILLFPLVTVYQASIAEKASLWVLAIKGLVFLAAVGLAFMAHDEFAFVERRLAAVVDRDGDNPSTLYLRGREYARQGMWARAQVHWAKAVALRPGKIDYRLALATAYVNLGQAERAEAHLSVAQQIEPENPQLQALLTHARATC